MASATGFATAATTLPLIMTPAPLLHPSRGGGVDVVRRPHSSPRGTAAGLLRIGRVRTKKFSTSPLSLIERCTGSSSASYTSSSHIPFSTVLRYVCPSDSARQPPPDSATEWPHWFSSQRFLKLGLSWGLISFAPFLGIRLEYVGSKTVPSSQLGCLP